MKTAYIICCNDSIEGVCLDEELAKKKMEDLKNYDFKTKWNSRTGRRYTEEEYNIFYWHIHEVQLFDH